MYRIGLHWSHCIFQNHSKELAHKSHSFSESVDNDHVVCFFLQKKKTQFTTNSSIHKSNFQNQTSLVALHSLQKQFIIRVIRIRLHWSCYIFWNHWNNQVNSRISEYGYTGLVVSCWFIKKNLFIRVVCFQNWATLVTLFLINHGCHSKNFAVHT